MKNTKNAKCMISYALILGSLLAIVVLVYLGSLPRKYDLAIGDTSPYDIVAPRAIADEVETERRAREASTQVPNAMMRSEGKSKKSVERVTSFIEIVAESRKDVYPSDAQQMDELDGNKPDASTPVNPDNAGLLRNPTESDLQMAASSLISACDQKLGVVLRSGMAEALMRQETTRFISFSNTLKAESKALATRTLDRRELQQEIEAVVQRLQNMSQYNVDDATLTGEILALLQEPNVEYNLTATNNARQAAYDRVKNNPVMVNRGTRIVTQGDVITAETLTMLQALDLTNDTVVDWQLLGGVAGLVLALSLIAFSFFHYYARDLLERPRNLTALLLTVLVVLAVSAYLGRDYPLTPPVYFAAVVLSAYFGLRTAIFVVVELVILISPMAGFTPSFALIALSGGTMAALFTKGISRQDNYAKIILATALTNLLLTFSLGILEKDSGAVISHHSLQSVMSGIFSVIAAIGIMPLFEMIFDTVSPLRLIELSQPGHPLLKRLFTEAPGTSQHSMMVANLADAAAESVGANAMIARVGAYFHDVGKLEAPLMFTENQEGENPHDFLSPEESTAIITRHPQDSLRLGRRHRLPVAVLKIAHEHHGTTVLQYFYRKALAQAEAEGREKPDINAYRYKTPIPSTIESGIVMLADSTEAAMRSTGTSNIEDAEVLIRSIVKNKIDQDQLLNSGLSFAQIELIVKAFLQVYAGHFHERIKYPDENKVS